MLQRFKNFHPTIVVIGDFMIDRYLWGNAERISPEAPVPVVAVQRESFSLGGAGNVVANLISLGAKVYAATVIGDDGTGQMIKAKLSELGANTESVVVESGRTSGIKTRLMATHSQIVRFDKESTEDINAGSLAKLSETLESAVLKADAVVLSDYKKGVLCEALTKAAIELANKAGVPVLVDPKGDDYTKYFGATLITPNKKEAATASKIAIKDESSLRLAGEKLKKELGLKYCVITLSEEGMAIFEDEKMTKIPTFAREVYDVTGAGDTVIAALSVAVSSGVDIRQACEFANKAAAVVVGKLGSATVTLDEIISYENRTFGDESDLKVLSLPDTVSATTVLKKDGKKIVFTNGCFDILHAGHVRYLSEAKRMGDFLVVGLNSDSSVKGLKGEGRPVNQEEDRATLLAALSSVDFVVIFDEETPLKLIEAIKPDILVKGADYEPQNIVGYDVVISGGGEVRMVKLVEGRSTTSVIEKIRGS